MSDGLDNAKLIQVDYASVDDFLDDYEENIALGTIIIRSAQALSKGQALDFAVTFPGLLQPLQLGGEVAWVGEPEPASDPAFGISLPAGTSHPQQIALRELVQRIRAGDQSLIADATLRVLVVEDNPHLADLIRRGLEAHLQRSVRDVAFEIHHVIDGLSGLEQVRSRSFELLLVDIFVPRLSGEDLIREVRGDPNLASLPIIALSASEDAEVRALDAGADIFLPKPVRLADLLAAMGELQLAL